MRRHDREPVVSVDRRVEASLEQFRVYRLSPTVLGDRMTWPDRVVANHGARQTVTPWRAPHATCRDLEPRARARRGRRRYRAQCAGVGGRSTDTIADTVATTEQFRGYEVGHRRFDHHTCVAEQD